MRNSRAKQSKTSYSDIAWWLVPLALFLGLALFLFGRPSKGPDELRVLARPSPDTELVSLGTKPTGAVDLHTEFIPPNESLRQRVLVNLRRFQTEYRQSAPAISVDTATDSTSWNRVAQALSNMLSSTGLSSSVRAPVAAPPDEASADILLYTQQANREIVHEFLKGLSPYINGRILLIFDQRHRLDRMQMIIQHTPQFDADGAVIFPGALESSKSWGQTP